MSKKAAVHSADGVGLLPSHGAAGCGCQSAPPSSRASSSTATVYLGYECGSAAGVPLIWKWTNFGDMVSRYWDVVSALAKLPVPVSRQYVSSPLSTPGVCLQPKRSKAIGFATMGGSNALSCGVAFARTGKSRSRTNAEACIPLPSHFGQIAGLRLRGSQFGLFATCLVPFGGDRPYSQDALTAQWGGDDMLAEQIEFHQLSATG
jgi:hypothetical protein